MLSSARLCNNTHAAAVHCATLCKSRHTGCRLAAHIDDELVRTGVAVLRKVLSTGLEVVKDVLLVAVGAAIMPAQAILPTTPANQPGACFSHPTRLCQQCAYSTDTTHC